jgi:hypothetical protein
MNKYTYKPYIRITLIKMNRNNYLTKKEHLPMGFNIKRTIALKKYMGNNHWDNNRNEH